MKYEVFWKNPGYKPRPALKKNIECDHLIVGGGIMGVSLAYFLNKMGAKNIVLIEKNTVGSGATGKSAGFLALKGEIDLTDIMAKYGKERGRDFWRANHEGLNLFKELVKKEKISCDFEVEDTIYGSIVEGRIDDKQEISVLQEYIIEKEIEKDPKLLTGKELKKEIKTPLFLYALKSHHQGASLNPLKFLQKFSQAIGKKGVKIFENTKLRKISKNTAITSKGKIKFKKIILATDLAIRSSAIKALRSTITISQKLTKKQLKSINLTPHKMVWDSDIIYHYMKITGDDRILLGYGDKLVKKDMTPELHKPHLKRIESFYKKLFPNINLKIEYAWSGDFGVTSDRIPIIDTKGNKISTGGAASQVVSAITAKHIAHKLLNKKHYLDDFFKHIKRNKHKFELFGFVKHYQK